MVRRRGGGLGRRARRPARQPDELSDLLEGIGGSRPRLGQHRGVPLPTGDRAAALSIPVADSLGWLVAVGAGLGGDGVGSSVTWIGRVAVAAVRLVARGARPPPCATCAAPTARWPTCTCVGSPTSTRPRSGGAGSSAMPGAVRALGGGEPRPVTLDLIGSVVNAIATDAAGRLELPAPAARGPLRG